MNFETRSEEAEALHALAEDTDRILETFDDWIHFAKSWACAFA